MTLKDPHEELEEQTPGIEQDSDQPQPEDDKVVSPAPFLPSKPYNGYERRKYLRYNLVYLSSEKAKLIINNNELEVLNISQGGLKFLYDYEIEIGTFVQGIIKFSNDQSFEVEGQVVWGKGSEFGMKFNNLFPLFQISCFQR